MTAASLFQKQKFYRLFDVSACVRQQSTQGGEFMDDDDDDDTSMNGVENDDVSIESLLSFLELVPTIRCKLCS